MHTVIPICKITHMGIQDLISRMRTTSLCIRGVTEKSPYAYRDAQIPVCIWGLVSIQSPYAYGDYILIPVCIRGLHTHNPRMHTGIDLDPHMHTGICHCDGADGADRCHSQCLCRSRRQWLSSLNAAAVNVGGGDGGLRPRRSLTTEAPVGRSRRRRSSSLTTLAKTPLPPQPLTTVAVDDDRHHRL